MNLVITDISVREADGLFCLNDLHRASGGANKDRPSLWLENQQAQKLVAEIEKAGIPAIQSKQGLGTFVCEDLVYAYAMWISAAFHLKVIRAYRERHSVPALPNFADPVSAARAWADATEREHKARVLAQQQASELEAQKPAVEFVERYTSASKHDCLNFRDAAKALHASEPEFKQFLMDLGVVFLAGKRQRMEPYKTYIETGRVEVGVGVTEDERQYAFKYWKFTTKGFEWIAGKWMARQLAERDARCAEA
ncbi:KilA-N domain-containing protein [Caballeronia sp. LZ001]|uniref:KilA-N domain-containing protein n=1 Tax=Caballeronia sp. LZ001 TaxID=3038553 RepID=UPI0028543A20|nr:KilA-N domain-containing protein [Caballeronia sp. LZ001]MDR5800660.1 KilA-N domain-containing protein [Caballeronia sp. LZ001]